jgi:hypothetical protein
VHRLAALLAYVADVISTSGLLDCSPNVLFGACRFRGLFWKAARIGTGHLAAFHITHSLSAIMSSDNPVQGACVSSDQPVTMPFPLASPKENRNGMQSLTTAAACKRTQQCHAPARGVQVND